jgi:hypothetical protein
MHDAPGLAVFSVSNERAGPKDRKYDPSRSHYKKVSLLRDRLIPAGGTTPTIIYSPFMEGTSWVKKTKEGNSLLWGGPPCGCPVRHYITDTRGLLSPSVLDFLS